MSNSKATLHDHIDVSHADEPLDFDEPDILRWLGDSVAPTLLSLRERVPTNRRIVFSRRCEVCGTLAAAKNQNRTLCALHLLGAADE